MTAADKTPDNVSADATGDVAPDEEAVAQDVTVVTEIVTDDGSGTTVSSSGDTAVIPETMPYQPPADAPRYTSLAEASADILPPDPVAAPSPATASVAAAPATPTGTPRTRWAGIIWGLALAAVAILALAFTLEPTWRAAAAQWWLGLNGVTGTAYAFLALGAVAVLCAAVGLIGRAQRARITRRTQA